MSGTLHLVRLKPPRTRLAAFAARRRIEDLDYVLHQALVETFGAAAPKPFRLIETRGDLLGYSLHDLAALKEYADLQRAQAPHWETSSAVLGLSDLDARPMPKMWTAGRHYRFELRARPVLRTSHAKSRGLPHERDVFLAAIEGRDPEEPVDRREVYLDWLARQVTATGGAELIAAEITGIRRTRVHRGGGGGNPEGPDVLFAGMVRVVDPVRFEGLLARGIGRHRAFGFGMMLLAPGG